VPVLVMPQAFCAELQDAPGVQLAEETLTAVQLGLQLLFSLLSTMDPLPEEPVSAHART
jgi:hypothetical protein